MSYLCRSTNKTVAVGVWRLPTRHADGRGRSQKRQYRLIRLDSTRHVLTPATDFCHPVPAAWVVSPNYLYIIIN